MVEKTDTKPSINYVCFTSTNEKKRFVLYPVKDLHDKESVKKATEWLYKKFKVLSLQIRWTDEDDSFVPPEKIPDQAIIKELNIELGKKESYIQELRSELQKKETDESRELRKQVIAEQQYLQLKTQLSKAKREIVNLRETISGLIIKLNQKQ